MSGEKIFIITPTSIVSELSSVTGKGGKKKKENETT